MLVALEWRELPLNPTLFIFPAVRVGASSLAPLSLSVLGDEILSQNYLLLLNSLHEHKRVSLRLKQNEEALVRERHAA